MAATMRAQETVARLEAFRRRGAGTDAERRAANWLATELEHPSREVRLEPFWCRPNWALAHVWHLVLAIAGSLVSVTDAVVGLALLAIAFLSISADALFGVSIGRRLTYERASQNVLARARPRRDGSSPALRLLITANYDAGRTGMAYRENLRNAALALRRAAPAGPGWLGWLCLAIAWLAVVAILRSGGHHSTAIGIAQFVPTVLLVLVLAGLIELATADYGPAANDNGSGAALALALVRALDAAPPRHIAIDLVLQGAGDGGAVGLRRHLRRHRREISRKDAAILALAASGAGELRWWTSDGSFFPLRYSKRLRQLCSQIAQDGNVSPYRGRGVSPAFPGRAAGVPAITLGCLDARGLATGSHRPSDVAAGVDPSALDATLEFALILVDALDAYLAETGAGAQAPTGPQPTGTPPVPAAEQVQPVADP